jgi:TatA/E family protein of Tat protein translocase
MGSLGVQEMIVIFLVALVLFGPKKLPELGKTLGKALTEFRRASNDLKATFEREMHTLEREADSLKQTADSTAHSIYQHTSLDQYPHDNYGPDADGLAHAITSGTTEPVQDPSTVSASVVESAESHGTVPTTPAEHPAAGPVAQVEGTVARSELGTHHS